MTAHISLTQLATSVLCVLSTSIASKVPSLQSERLPSIAASDRKFEYEEARHGERGHGDDGTFQIAPAVRKMSPDPGEMFFYEYWGFEEVYDQRAEWTDTKPDQRAWNNYTKVDTVFQSPILPHLREESTRYGWLPRALFGRGFTCPENTESCASIGRPNYCCQNGLNCDIVKDTGQGDVGCCPNESGCSGDVAACPSGYSSCSEEQGGGCCIPGYACEGVGCVKTTTQVVTLQSTATASVVSSQTQSMDTTTASTCLSGFQTCPASLGGGCCPPDHVCASSAVCQPKAAPSTSTVTAAPTMPAAPVRGTSDSAAPTTAAPSQVYTSGPCPSNFYPCSAYFPGAGCCQIGRDCASTSCPARTTISELVSNGVTILLEATVGGGQQGNCADGWMTCAPTLGGGCCPNGYNCGTASCTASASAIGTGQVAKENIAESMHIARLTIIFSCSVAALGAMWM